MSIGDIGTVIDSLEFDAADALQISVCRVNATVIAIAYRGPDSDGWLKTVTIDVTGHMGDTVIDSLEFSVTDCTWPTIRHIYDNVFAIAYANNLGRGQLITVTIDVAGNIDNAAIDTWEYDASGGTHPGLIQIQGNIFAIAYSQGSSVGKIISLEINNNGTIEKSAIDSLTFQPSTCNNCDIQHITGNIYTVTYTGTSDDGFIISVSIDTEGNISNSPIDTLEFAPTDGGNIRQKYIGNGIIAAVSTDYWYDGWLYTIGIDEAGNIENTVIDSWEYEETNCTYPQILQVDANTFCIGFSNGSNHGIVGSVNIDDQGNITKSWYDSIEYDNVLGTYNDLINTQGNIVCIAYQGPDNDGWLKTISVEMPPSRGPDYLMLMGIG